MFVIFPLRFVVVRRPYGDGDRGDINDDGRHRPELLGLSFRGSFSYQLRNCVLLLLLLLFSCRSRRLLFFFLNYFYSFYVLFYFMTKIWFTKMFELSKLVQTCLCKLVQTCQSWWINGYRIWSAVSAVIRVYSSS